MSIRLVIPTNADKERAIEFKQEFFDNGEFTINGSEMLDNTEDYEAWITSVENNASINTVNPEWVITDTFSQLMKMIEL